MCCLGTGSVSTPSRLPNAGECQRRDEYQITRPRLPLPYSYPRLSRSSTDVQSALPDHCRSPVVIVTELLKCTDTTYRSTIVVLFSVIIRQNHQYRSSRSPTMRYHQVPMAKTSSQALRNRLVVHTRTLQAKVDEYTRKSQQEHRQNWDHGVRETPIY